jgi:hypothetical protein
MSVPTKFLVPLVEAPLVQLTFVSRIPLSYVEHDAHSWESANQQKRKPVTYRYYPCMLSSNHRTVIVSDKIVYDPVYRVRYPHVGVWQDSCTCEEHCRHMNCRPELFVNDYNQVDALERMEKKCREIFERRKSQKDTKHSATLFLSLVAKHSAREAWIDAKENWGVEQAEKKLAKQAKKQAKKQAQQAQ